MRWMKWAAFLSAAFLVVSCFLTWVFIRSKSISISGVDATGTYYGKPGYFNLLMAFFFVLFSFIPKIWAKRSNLLVTAINLAWAVRNYFIITGCQAGECPEKHLGIYLLLLASVGMLLCSLFPDMKLPVQNQPGS
jgi:hypothetical protein